MVCELNDFTEIFVYANKKKGEMPNSYLGSKGQVSSEQGFRYSLSLDHTLKRSQEGAHAVAGRR